MKHLQTCKNVIIHTRIQCFKMLPSRHWNWHGVCYWLVILLFFSFSKARLKWVEEICQLLPNLCTFCKKLKGAGADLTEVFQRAVNRPDKDLQHTEDVHWTRSGEGYSRKKDVVCKSFWTALNLPLFAPLLHSPFACWASLLTCCPRQDTSPLHKVDTSCVVPKEVFVPFISFVQIYILIELLCFSQTVYAE